MVESAELVKFSGCMVSPSYLLEERASERRKFFVQGLKRNKISLHVHTFFGLAALEKIALPYLCATQNTGMHHCLTHVHVQYGLNCCIARYPIAHASILTLVHLEISEISWLTIKSYYDMSIPRP